MRAAHGRPPDPAPTPLLRPIDPRTEPWPPVGRSGRASRATGRCRSRWSSSRGARARTTRTAPAPVQPKPAARFQAALTQMREEGVSAHKDDKKRRIEIYTSHDLDRQQWSKRYLNMIKLFPSRALADNPGTAATAATAATTTTPPPGVGFFVRKRHHCVGEGRAVPFHALRRGEVAREGGESGRGSRDPGPADGQGARQFGCERDRRVLRRRRRRRSRRRRRRGRGRKRRLLHACRPEQQRQHG